MPIPDANRTLAAALYGACVALCQPKKLKEGEIPASWNETSPAWCAAMIKAAGFLNSYCHGISAGNIDRARAGEALAECLRDTTVAKTVKLPYAVMVEIFVSGIHDWHEFEAHKDRFMIRNPFNPPAGDN